MIAKFLLTWLILLSGVYSYAFLAKKKERNDINWLVGKLVVSGVISVLLIAIVMVINNFSGV